MLQRSDLRSYQNIIVKKIKLCFHDDPAHRLPGVIAALEPGAGKTGASLTAARDLLDEGKIKRVLVVAPLLVAQTTWPDEFGEWEHLKDMTWTLLRVEDGDEDVAAAAGAAYQAALERFQSDDEFEWHLVSWLDLPWLAARKFTRILLGTPAKRAEPYRQAAAAEAKLRKLAQLAAEPTQVHIMNKEQLDWLWDHSGKGARLPYDLLIIDDVRETRSGKKRVKREKDDKTAAKAPLSRFGIMAAMRSKVKATVVLTGTPTPKGLEDMWGLTYQVDLGRRLGLTKTAFLNRWFWVDRKTFAVEAKDGSFRSIMSKVKDVMFSLDPKDYPDLPPYQVVPIRVKLSDDVIKRYRKFRREMVDEIADVEAVNAGVLHGKLLQFANGSMYREKGDDVWIHDAKIEALKNLVESLNGTPLLVAYTYQFDVDRIMKAFPKAVHLTPDNASRVIKDWNADKIELLLCHRASAGHGLNAQKGMGHMCEYGLTSDAELYLQFLKRIWRPGRRFPVFNHVIIAEGTIDEEIFPEYLDPKIELQSRVMEEVRVDVEMESLLG